MKRGVLSIPSVHLTRAVLLWSMVIEFLFCIGVMPLYAITYPDMEMNTPNPVGSGARALGIGGAFIAVADDATAASWNPSGMIQLKRPEISFVGDIFSWNANHKDVGTDAGSEERHLNYLSMVMPFELFRMNMVCSLNYQKLYEFSKKYEVYSQQASPTASTLRISKKQNGALNTLSPAFAIQLLPCLYFGATANFWRKKELDDYWENSSIIEEEEVAAQGVVRTTGKYYEHYGFSGFNFHIGLLWKITQYIHCGGVYKAPFEADIDHEYQLVSMVEHSDAPTSNTYDYQTGKNRFTLHMPTSYGIGVRFQPKDTYLIACDIYRTHWEDYILHYPTGEEISPINNKKKEKADIHPVNHIHIGGEYFFLRDVMTIPLRFGLFYDPEPTEGGEDDFYGMSMGMGIAKENYAFDIAYQYRYGKKYDIELESTSVIHQRYIYLSTIYYF
ncbi:MAG: OmpP1/FadL family transporter [bacterium]